MNRTSFSAQAKMFLFDEIDGRIEVREINPGLALHVLVPTKLKTAKTP